MSNPPGKPDFIVDPRGRVQDVRHGAPQHVVEYAPASTSESKKGRSGSKAGQVARIGVIPIPIGLIVTLIIWLLSSSKESRADEHLSKGVQRLDSGNYAQAIVEFDKALELVPDLGMAYSYRGLAQLARGKLDEAFADSHKAVEILTDTAVVYLNRGIVYSTRGNDKKAIEDFDTAILLDDRCAEAYYNRGLSYLELNRYDEAILDFDRAIELTFDLPFHPPVTVEPENAFDRYRMKTEYGRPLRLGTDLPSIYTGRGLAYLGNLQFIKAISDFDNAIELEPYYSRAYYGRGVAHLVQWNYEEAVRDLQMVVALDNDREITQAAQDLLTELGME